MSTRQPQTTVIYARQSLDREGNQLAVDRQIKEARTFAKAHGLEVVEPPLVDNSISATTGVKRPQFEKLLSSKPESITAWHIDRLCRVTKDLERVIDLGVNVFTVKAGNVDLSNPAGRAVARTVTAWATYEGEHKALRQRAANDQKAASGLPHGGRRCYGYAKDGKTIIKAEARAIRRAVKMVLAGRSVHSIVADLAARGVTTTAGNPWQRTELRRLLMNPRLAGLRVHRGQVLGRAKWRGIIDEDTHRAVVAILNDPGRRRPGRPRAYLLSGVARCGVCGWRLYGRKERRGTIYVCESGAHLGRRTEEVDELVAAVVVGRLSRPDATDLFVEDTSGEVAELQSEQRGLTARLKGLADAYADGNIDLAQLTSGTVRIKERLAAVEAKLPALVTAPAAASLVTAKDVQAAWDGMTIQDQRAVVGALVTVTVLPPGRGARKFDPETVKITWLAAAA